MTSSHNHGTKSSNNRVAGTIDADLKVALTRIAALEAQAHTHSAPGPAPTSGIPTPLFSAGSKLHKNFADGLLTPFIPATWPNDHEADRDLMLGWSPDKTQRLAIERYATSQVSVHDGYLDIRCTRQADGSWLAGLAATLDLRTNPPGRTLSVATAERITFAARMNGGKGAWQGLWLLDAWRSPEIDWPELIGGRFTANVHGSTADGQKAAVPADGAWHVFAIERTATATHFLLDGQLVGTGPAMAASMAVIADAKVGLVAPDATTPDLSFHLAWLTVD